MNRSPLLALICVSFCLQPSLGQSVFIPDTHLRDWFNTYAPGCVDASGWFDPTDPGILADSSFELHVNWPDADLTGIDALPHVYYLGIEGEDNTSPSSIPAFPPTIKRLILEYMPVTAIGSFPEGLEQIGFTWLGGLSSIPAWPSTLKSVALRSVLQVESVPPLPSGVVSFALEEMPLLTSVPALDPELRYLYVEDCQLLTDLPSIPNGVSILSVRELPQLVALPSWPDSLRDLHLEELDLVSTLPTLPDELHALYVSFMPQFASLPLLPDGLVSLTMINCPNFNSWAGAAPSSLRGVEITNCWAFSCLPWLHDSMNVYVDFTGVQCIQNVPQHGFTISPSWLAGRPCMVYGPGCSSPVITGTTYDDQNSDGVHDAGEPPYPFATVQLQPGGALCGSDAHGHYRINVGPGSYSMFGELSPYSTSVQPASGYDATLVLETDQDSLNDFGYSLIAGAQDVKVDLCSTAPVVGFERGAWLVVRNSGTVDIPVVTTLELDTSDSYVTSDVPPTSISGQTIVWDLGMMPAGTERQISLTLQVPFTTWPMTLLNEHAWVLPVVGDLVPENNTVAFTEVTSSAIDPNDKTVSPDHLSQEEVSTSPPLTYTIRFQNTGTASAQRVVITDTLSTDLQWDSFSFLSGSHPSTWSLLSGVLTFVFDDIQLPDSNVNEPGSHGFVRFSMRAQPTLFLGSVISNIANIYFDFNEPVITSPAVFSVEAPLSIHTDLDERFHVFPVPAGDQLFLTGQAVKRGSDYRIFDVDGALVAFGELSGTSTTVPVSAFASGIYTVLINATSGPISARFIKR